MPNVSTLVLAPLAFAFSMHFARAKETDPTRPPRRHVVVVVWDGMRPDFVSEQNTPALWKLATGGVTFRNQHPVYLSATNVNGIAIATGVYPDHSGIIANHEFRPRIDSKKPVDVEAAPVVTKGDKISNGDYIASPTVSELVQKSGGRTLIASSKTVGLLEDRDVGTPAERPSPGASRLPGQRSPRRPKAGPPLPQGDGRMSEPAANSVTLFAGKARPEGALAPIVAALGPFPSSFLERDSWTTEALTGVLWKDGVPQFSLLWLGEPDLTQHVTAPGAPAALEAIKSSDLNLATVLAALDQEHARETTDIFVVSDHGFSTIQREVDLPKILKAAGFDITTEFRSPPRPGEIMMVGGGGSVLFYVTRHEPAVIRGLVEFLQQSDYAGVIFTKTTMPGTFTLDEAKIDSTDAPDVLMSFRWNNAKNQFGVAGMIDADWQRAAGKGTHATLGRFDMHNTLIAAGPDFRRGTTDDLPTGNIDLAPTILKILGIQNPHPMDGRVLCEAMVGTVTPAPHVQTTTIEATKEFQSATWRQTLQISRVGSTIYLDQGNGELVPIGGSSVSHRSATRSVVAGQGLRLPSQ
jgi:arylsulfatase A-like enzyme